MVASVTNTNTMPVVINVSRRDGLLVTLEGESALDEDPIVLDAYCSRLEAELRVALRVEEIGG